MRIDIITLFPEMCETIMNESIIGRARRKGLIQFSFHQLRDYGIGRHKQVDDTPYGGGKGMLLKPEPIAAALDKLEENLGKKPHVIFMSPRGKVLNQEKVKELSNLENICILCGHYEGIDERIIEEYVDEEISCGDYVLTGGEMPALILSDAVSRMIPGVLSDDVCFTDESHFSGLLEYPQYTHPQIWRDKQVPDVLTGGNHAKIEDWKHKKSLEITQRYRPDMIEKAQLSKEDKKYLKQIQS